jgi:hypothetical protein
LKTPHEQVFFNQTKVMFPVKCIALFSVKRNFRTKLKTIIGAMKLIEGVKHGKENGRNQLA